MHACTILCIEVGSASKVTSMIAGAARVGKASAQKFVLMGDRAALAVQ